MSGQQFYSGNFNNFLKRRAFLLRVGLVTSGIFLNGCIQKIKPKKYQITGQLNGPNAAAGHILRDKTPLPPPSKTVKVKTLIVGAGISGLSAGRWLQKNGETDFQILEMEDHTGGNAHTGKNEIAAYPLGAHYVTIANNEDKILLDFFQEIKVITHHENGLPFYNEFYLTFDPEERLLINGEWQEGLIPDFGVPVADKEEIKRFLTEVNRLKTKKGNDGKFIFNVPITESSTDENYTQLDKITFKQYLAENNYHSKYLIWYLNYACKDDYGQLLDKISAWAGLHYFASRRGKAANAEDNAILTWPQGNAWLAQRMTAQLTSHITKSVLCYNLTRTENGLIKALVYHQKTKQTTSYEVEKVILCTPQFVNQRLLTQLQRPKFAYDVFNYSPWLIANITLDELPVAKGMNMCWDNVAFDTPSVGYVNAAHQDLNLGNSKRVITYYLPLCDFEPRVARLAAYARTYEQWLNMVMPELEYMHPGIEQAVSKIDFWVWGHGMIAPTPNLIFGADRRAAQMPINNQVFFAHTDLSGISIFEEAFHQGIQAAKSVLNG